MKGGKYSRSTSIYLTFKYVYTFTIPLVNMVFSMDMFKRESLNSPSIL